MKRGFLRIRTLVVASSASFIHPSSKRPYSSMSRLGAVTGEGEKQNHVIVCRAKKQHDSYVIFFGGDVQDYKEVMLGHRDNHRYQEWNLESTAEILQEKYPTSDVIVIKPVVMRFNTFSVYSNFVESGMIGVPMSTKYHGAWLHLSKLFQNSITTPTPKLNLKAAEHEQSSEDSRTSEANVFKNVKLPKHIIGFSKGCVVLNQLVYELAEASKESHTKEFVSSISSMTWLDGGHSGHADGVPTWVHDPEVLGHLRDTGIRIHTHVTPYQVCDQSRPWIGKEHKKFIDTLRNLHVNVSNVLHFEDDAPSIQNHFEIIRTHQNS